MGLTDVLRAMFPPLPARNAVVPPWLPGQDNFLPYAFLASGQNYPLNLNQTYGQDDEEESRAGPIGAYTSNAIVFACMAKRMKLFSEARPRYQRLEKGKPGDLWGDASLGILEHPWPGAATGDLLARAIQDADWEGNFYATRRNNRIMRMPPAWVDLILADGDDIQAEVIGLAYYAGGKHLGREPELLQRREFAHFAPYPDPQARFRGMSWLTPVIREIAADNATTNHKLKFFQNGATPNMIVKRDDALASEAFREWVDQMRKQNEGTANAYKTLYLSAGADATVVGKDFQQIEFKATQGAGEVRIAAASGLHPAIIGISESLQGSSLNAGNFGAARRLVADTFLRPDWRNFWSSMEMLVPPPNGSRLWYDDKDIPFLREDSKDAALIQQVIGQTIGQYIRDGFTADSAKLAAVAENPTLLEHTGLFSVQLQAPGSTKMPNGEVPGETPVGPGAKPETAPATTNPKRDVLLEQLVVASERRAAAAELRADQPSVVNVHPANVEVNVPEQPVHVTVEPTVVNVTTPEVRNEFTVEPAPVTVTVEPTPVEVTVENTVEPTPVEIRNEVTVEPTPIEVTVEPTPIAITNELPPAPKTTKTIKRDAKGAITHIEES